MKIKKKSFSIILALALILSPVLSSAAFAVKDDAPLLTVEMISDTHIGIDGADSELANLLDSMSKEKNDIDALVIAGDLSNDGSEKNVSQFYDILDKHNKIGNTVTVPGNHDMGQMTYSGEETRARMISYRNEHLGYSADTIYYSTEVKGYKFIVLGDEGENINCVTITDKQIDFLEKELEEGTADGKPAFVICHWPPAFINGSWLLWPIWPGGNIDMFTTAKLRKVMDKFDNVFFISGHLHMGLNNDPIKTYLSLATYEVHGKTAYVNLPSCDKTSRWGIKDHGTGIQFKVYSDRVDMFGRNYVTGNYYDNCVYTKELVMPAASVLKALPPKQPEEILRELFS